MSNVGSNLGYLKDSERFPKETVTPVTVPTVQVSAEEWNKAVRVMQQVENNENMCDEMLKSFNSEILGELPLIDVALYDDTVESTVDGTTVTLTKLDNAAGYESYGIAIPSTLTEGKTYTVKGSVTNNTQHQINVAVISSLYSQGATKSYLYYHVPIGGTVTVENTFTYAAATTKYIIFESFVGTGNSVTFDLHIVNEDAALPTAQQDIVNLQSGVAQNAQDITNLADDQEDLYTDVFGKKRLIDTVAADSQVEIEVDDDVITMTALQESTGAPHYGIMLPSTLVDGEEYTIKGYITNNTTTELPVGNYGSLTPSSSPNFWLAYNIPVGTTQQIDYTFTYDSDYPYIIISKSNLRYVGDEVIMSLYIEQGENLLGRIEALEGEEGTSSVITSAFPGVKATDGTLLALLNSGTNSGWTFTQETNGVRIVASGSTGTYKDDGIALFPEYEGEFKPNTKYGVFIDYEAETIPLRHSQDTLFLTFFFKATGVSNNASVRIREGEILDSGYTRSFQIVGFVETGASNLNFEYVRCVLTKMNTTGTTDTITNILIKRLFFFEVTSVYSDYTELDFVALFKNAGTFSSLAVVTESRLQHANLLYDGQKLKSLGDSLPETTSFQPLIAQALGMKYDAYEEINDQTVTWEGSSVTAYESCLGGTRVVPVIRGTAKSQASMGSIYMRARSLKYYAPDVVIVLAGYNDVHAGEAYIDGGTAVEPADYGINDAPYTGGEIDLLSDPTLSVPSFGACYKGMIEQILTDMPWCRLILCGIPRGSGETSLYGTANDWVAAKNEVIEYIANKYGCTFVDLSKVYGANALNYQWLTKDGLHFSDFGGRRVAQELLAKAF